MDGVQRSRLYARRLRGDIGPLNTEPVGGRGLPGKIFAPAISLTGVDQYYDEESIVQNYNIGARMVADERVFHYSQAVAAIVHPYTYRLNVSSDQILAVNDLISTVLAAAASYQVTLTVGAFQAGVVVADEFVGGWLECWPIAGGSFMHRRIIANTATAVGGDIVVTVDRPFNVALGIGSQCTIHPSPYRNTRAAGTLAGFETAVGLAPIPVTIAYYYWNQTWGPCFIAPTGGWPLAVADFTDVYLHSDGCINSSLGEGIGATVSPQRIGYVMGSGNYGCAEIMLQLAP